MGVGRSDTPMAFVNACEVFVYTENLLPKSEDDDEVLELVAAEDSPFLET